MANPTLHWRMLAPVALPNPTIGAVMDAVYQMGTATAYADGTTRTPGTFTTPGTASAPASLGTGSAWTWNYDATTFGTGSKTACYAYAPTTTAINQAIIIAGTTNVTGAVWKQLYTDPRTASYVYAGVAKNTGVYTSWNNATTPFTAGDFTGFAAGLIASNINYLIMFESEEAVVIQGVNTTGSTSEIFAFGALVDPLSANTANAETDGRLYGVMTTGATFCPATWMSATGAAGAAFNNSATASDAHFVTFTPGAGTVVSTARFGTYLPTYAFTSRSGDIPQVPYQCWNGTQYIGQLRQMNIIRDGLTGEALQLGTTVKGYTLAASGNAVTSDALLLVY